MADGGLRLEVRSLRSEVGDRESGTGGRGAGRRTQEDGRKAVAFCRRSSLIIAKRSSLRARCPLPWVSLKPKANRSSNLMPLKVIFSVRGKGVAHKKDEPKKHVELK